MQITSFSSEIIWILMLIIMLNTWFKYYYNIVGPAFLSIIGYFFALGLLKTFGVSFYYSALLSGSLFLLCLWIFGFAELRGQKGSVSHEWLCCINPITD